MTSATRRTDSTERVLVTGANRGLGLEFVRRFAARGDRVLATCRRPDAADALQELGRAHPGRIEILPLDVTDSKAIAATAERVRADGDGSLDILVNNAGVSPRGEELSNLDPGRMLTVLSVNTVAPMIVARHLRSLLLAARHPRIANISSAMGSLTRKDDGRHYSYAASKAALNMLGLAAAHDLRNEGIIVVALHPGWVRTDLGGPNATLSPAASVAGMVDVIAGLTLQDSGRFIAFDGTDHPW